VTLFVDTSAFYAAADAGDQGHERTREALSSGEPLVTSDHVVVETWILLRHRLGREATERWWSAVREGAAQVESVGPADLEVAWGIGQAFADHDFSIVDRTSFAVMQRLGVYRAATLDRDFAVFRYGPRRDRAFEVVP
jgi:predicted nucleic acid-binding protein